MSARPYAEVIGDPIAQSKSPAIHNFWLAKLGIEAEYRACHVRGDELKDYLRQRNADENWRGCNVTMPHKQAVMPLLDRLDPTAAEIGAVNTIVMRDFQLEGHNTDGVGFMESLRPFIDDAPLRKGHSFSRAAYIVGAGGAAKAIAHALDAAHFTIVSYSRDPAKADRELGRYVWDKDLLCTLEDLARHTAKPIEGDGPPTDVFVNASPLGMAGHPPLVVNWPGCVEDNIVYDIVTHPLETPLLKAARARGLRTIDGLAMLIGQAAAAFEKFFGEAPPREDGDAELRRLLTS